MLMVGTRNGFYRFNYFQERFVPDSLFNSVLPPGANIIRTFHPDRDGNYWFSFENEHMGWTEMVVKEYQDEHLEVLVDKAFLRLPPAASADMFFSDPESGVWFSKSDELYHFDKTFSRKDSLALPDPDPQSDDQQRLGSFLWQLILNRRERELHSLQASQDEDTQSPILNTGSTILSFIGLPPISNRKTGFSTAISWKDSVKPGPSGSSSLQGVHQSQVWEVQAQA